MTALVGGDGEKATAKATADPSTAFGARIAPNFAQDDSVVVVRAEGNDKGGRRSFDLVGRCATFAPCERVGSATIRRAAYGARGIFGAAIPGFHSGLFS